MNSRIPPLRVQFLLESLANIKVAHWTCTSYPEHVILGELYSKLEAATDSLVETGNNFDDLALPAGVVLKLKQYKSCCYTCSWLESLASYLDSGEKTSDCDLASIYADMLSDVNTAIGLLKKARCSCDVCMNER